MKRNHPSRGESQHRSNDRSSWAKCLLLFSHGEKSSVCSAGSTGRSHLGLRLLIRISVVGNAGRSAASSALPPSLPPCAGSLCFQGFVHTACQKAFHQRSMRQHCYCVLPGGNAAKEHSAEEAQTPYGPTFFSGLSALLACPLFSLLQAEKRLGRRFCCQEAPSCRSTASNSSESRLVALHSAVSL